MDDGIFLRTAALSDLRAADQILPDNLRRQLDDMIAHGPFSTFVHGFLSAKLASERAYEPKVSAKLDELPGYADLDRIADDIVAAFVSLPWTYSIFVPLALNAEEENQEETRLYPVTGDVDLVAPGQDFVAEFTVLPARENPPLGSFVDLIAGRPSAWNGQRYYLRFRIEGYISDYVTTAAVTNTRLLVRSIGGILLASPYVTMRSGYSLFPREGHLYVYRHFEDEYKPQRRHPMPAEYAEKLDAMVWANDWSDFRGRSWPVVLRSVADYLGHALASNEHAATLQRCAQWLFDSRCGANELLQFVQATVALEILLGDKSASDVVGIAELLSNRCAFFLAESEADRRDMIKKIKDSYQTRSSIVHRGKHLLTPTESAQLWVLQWLCAAVLRKEMHLLTKVRDQPTRA